MGNVCRPTPGGDSADLENEFAREDSSIPDEDQSANCLLSQKLSCFEKSDSFADGSEVSTPGPKSYSGYVPVTPISAMSCDAGEEGYNSRFYPDQDVGPIEPVNIHLYDLNTTFAHMNSVTLDMMGIGGALHVGVEVLGNEWSFGMQGVSVTQPKQNQYYTFRQTVPMGNTLLKRKEIETVILALKRRWSGNRYDILERNCGHFCNELCEKLRVGRMPAWVTRVAESMATLPGATTLKEAITRVVMEDDGYVAQEDQGSEGFGTPKVMQQQGFPCRPGAGSPVRGCVGGGGDAGVPLGVLPRARCEAFRVHEGQKGSSQQFSHRAQLCADGSLLTDKYGGDPRTKRTLFSHGGA